MITQEKKAWLVLGDGTVYPGRSFGSEGTAIGEVVFDTAVVGYQELLTDPASRGKLLVQTFPLIGNYGVNGEDVESDTVHCAGYIVREWCEIPSNYRMEGNIDSHLGKNGVVGIWDIDTRALTRRLRDGGAVTGMVTTRPVEGWMDEILAQLAAYREDNGVAAVTCQGEETLVAEEERFRVALYDLGVRKSLLRWLLGAGCTVIRLPAGTPAGRVKELAVDGIVLSGGPGDPNGYPELLETVKALGASGIPILGVGLGHQLMALAQGGKVGKMTHGHRGANQPVTDLDKGETFITLQSHSYVVTELPAGVGNISHQNANDKSCEGIRYTALPCLTVQFHPQSCTGPRDATRVLDEFAAMMKK